MTPSEKMDWMRLNCCSVSVEFNEHHLVHMTAFEWLVEHQGLDPEIEQRCEDLDQIVLIKVYPSTPIGFYQYIHWDLSTAINHIYEIVRADREAAWKSPDCILSDLKKGSKS